jgi:anti-sigma factor (TIGR02949 family)
MMGWFRRIFRSSPTCAEVAAVMQAYLDGEVDEAEARRVVAHLDACAGCNHEVQIFRNIKQALEAKARPVDPQIRAALESFAQDVSRGAVDG